MCKRDCVYRGGINTKQGFYDYSCNYCGVMRDTGEEIQTRTKRLLIKLEKKHPNWDEEKKKKWMEKYLSGENCPFFEDIAGTGKKRHGPVWSPAKKTGETEPTGKKQNMPQGDTKKYMPPVPEEMLISCHAQGLSDRKTAQLLGIRESQVYRWRKDRGIKSNYNYSSKRLDEDRARELYNKGLTDSSIARELGCTQPGVSAWRYREGLPAQHPHARMDQEEIRRLYDKGYNDTEIARMTGHNTDSIRRWRKRNRLKSNYTPERMGK